MSDITGFARARRLAAERAASVAAAEAAYLAEEREAAEKAEAEAEAEAEAAEAVTFGDFGTEPPKDTKTKK